jgi:hypothetical protein
MAMYDYRAHYPARLAYWHDEYQQVVIMREYWVRERNKREVLSTRLQRRYDKIIAEYDQRIAFAVREILLVMGLMLREKVK